MSGSRSRRRRKRSAAAKHDGKPVASRPASELARRRVPPVAAATVVAVAKEVADPAVLRSEIRALKRALAAAEEKANDADAKRTRAVGRATATLRRENESLEAHLTLLVQEIGLIKHLIDRVPRLEADLRTKDLQIAERERAWEGERTALASELERLRGAANHSNGSGKSARAAAAAAGGRAHYETAR